MKSQLISRISLIILALSISSYSEVNFSDNLDQLIQLKQKLVIPDPAAKTDFILANIRSIQVDNQGIMYILDSKELKVKVFNVDGVFLREFGTKGQGPGEFQSPVEIFIRDEILSVFDFGNMRISYYSLDGNHLKDINLLKLGGFFRPEAEDEASIYGNLLEWESDGSQWLKLVRYDKKTELISTISKVKNDVIYPDENPLADTFKLRIRKDKVVAWTYPKNYVIFFMFEDGKIIRQITKKYDPTKISTEDKERLINMRYGGKSNIPPRVNLIWPEYYSPIDYLIIGDNDWLYIRTNEKNRSGESKYDIFDERGNFRSSFYPEHSIRLIKDNMAYAVAEDAEGFPVVKRYEMKWNKIL